MSTQGGASGGDGTASTSTDLTPFFWALKLGAAVNLYFLAQTFTLEGVAIDWHVVLPAQILFTVSAYRCVFPVSYKDNVVLHSSALSSVFATRLLATFSEVAYIYQFSHVLRLLDRDGSVWIEALSWIMVAQVSVSQCFVWGAILTGKIRLFFYEEVGWAVIFTANTVASVLLIDDAALPRLPLYLNLVFGVIYLPWQFFHLRMLRADAEERKHSEESQAGVTLQVLMDGLQRSIREKNRTASSEAWGGFIGVTWMVAYWATLIPLWSYYLVVVFGSGPI